MYKDEYKYRNDSTVSNVRPMALWARFEAEGNQIRLSIKSYHKSIHSAQVLKIHSILSFTISSKHLPLGSRIDYSSVIEAKETAGNRCETATTSGITFLALLSISADALIAPPEIIWRRTVATIAWSWSFGRQVCLQNSFIFLLKAELKALLKGWNLKL